MTTALDVRAARTRRSAIARVGALAHPALVVAWVASVSLFWFWLARGWIPHDEGTLAQSALRVLDGQLPHRDYDEIYTGLLAYLDAGAFRAFGPTLMAMRLAMAAAVALWVPALYYCASRFVRPWGAALVTVAAVAWSVPNYPVGMPSWYNTFLATAGLAALLRHCESGRARWLWIAGACGGVSFLFKVVGLYFVAAALLYAAFYELGRERGAAASPRARDGVFRALVVLAVALFVAALWRLLGARDDAAHVVYFVLPSAALTVAIVARAVARAAGDPTLPRLRRLLALVVPVLGGAAIPVVLFLLPYGLSASLGDFVRGVFVLPLRRLSFAEMPPLPLRRMSGALPLLVLAIAGPSVTRRRTAIELAALVAVLFAIAIAWPANGSTVLTYRFVWASLRTLGPSLVVLGAIRLVQRAGDPLVERRAFAALAVFAVCSVVQFPFSAPVYFCFVVPLLALALLAVLSLAAPIPASLGATVAAAYLAFALLRVNPGFVTEGLGGSWAASTQTEPLPFAVGGGVRGSAAVNAEYAGLVSLVRAHAGGDFIYATPDCPEVYVLTGKRNPTRTLFDFFDDTTGRSARILALLDARHVRAVALRSAGDFSGAVPADLDSALAARFPASAPAGRFTVRWR